jgi:RNase H-fold protein (predicted Holliday junction resolvase)
MAKKTLQNNPKVLGLDVSTRTIGWALFDMRTQELMELTHVSPRPKLTSENKIEELLLKADVFKSKLEEYKNLGITKVIIEEPLLNSNNIYTVQTLLRYNSFITKNIYDVLGLVPEFISTYNSRKFAFPSLVGPNDKGRNVLFGGYPKDIDKKQVIWDHVNSLCPEVNWLYGKTGTLKKENFDMADAACCVIGYINMSKLEKSGN